MRVILLSKVFSARANRNAVVPSNAANHRMTKAAPFISHYAAFGSPSAFASLAVLINATLFRKPQNPYNRFLRFFFFVSDLGYIFSFHWFYLTPCDYLQASLKFRTFQMLD